MVFGFGKNKSKHEVYTKKESDSIFKSNDDIVVLTGYMTLQANTSESLENDNATFTSLALDFPKGFNKDNCVYLSFGGKFFNTRGYSYGSPLSISNAMVSGNTPKMISLGGNAETDNANKIVLQVGNYATSVKEFYYKIVLMRINPDISNYELGDVNMDGKITQEDLTLVQNYLSGTGALTEKQLKLADLSEDGKIDSMDTYLLVKKINGVS